MTNGIFLCVMILMFVLLAAQSRRRRPATTGDNAYNFPSLFAHSLLTHDVSLIFFCFLKKDKITAVPLIQELAREK